MARSPRAFARAARMARMARVARRRGITRYAQTHYAEPGSRRLEGLEDVILGVQGSVPYFLWFKKEMLWKSSFWESNSIEAMVWLL